ncbi:hypothetical protein VCHA54P496_20391 [Vibrio chagasii]|nr:hypothetical protein VCHA54P495_20391 [Vibrio chagasii]CAH7220012.1 hypothetical protein VCHA54P496_20391 [Vibrio chagasii]CAH7264404.1 hypothetical protein VCHA54P486_10122 [Vibrio chagasii]
MTVKTVKQDLDEALDRLINRTPITKANLQRVQAGKPLKISVSGVELEAGRGNGAARHYPTLLKEIREAEEDRVSGSPRSSEEVSDEVVMSSSLYKDLEKKLEKTDRKKRKAEATILELREECKRKDAALNEKSAELDEIIASMWEHVPRDAQRALLIEKTENIIRFQKGS